MFPVRIKGHYLKIGSREILFAFVSDIIESKSLEKKLQRYVEEMETLADTKMAQLKLEQEKFERFVNLAPVGIAINRLNDGLFEYINNEISQFMGYSIEELNTMNYWQVTPKKYEQDEQKQILSLNKHGRYGPYQKEYIHKDGHIIPVLLSGIKAKNNKGEEVIWSVIQDISEQLKIQEELRESKEIAERASQSKSEFLANMSHEIRTPLNGIVGMLQLLTKSKLSKKQKTQLNIARDSANTLLVLINDILDFSKIEAGQLNIEAIPFNLLDLIKNIAEIYQGLISKGSQVKLCIETTGIRNEDVIGDPIRIRQIITNLLTNAAKFTHAGEVKIKASLNSIDEDFLLFKCSVIDTGVGIKTERLEEMFKPFTQADSSTTRQYGGTGLGLSICRELCSLMGGTINATSIFGKGSCFSFELILRNQANLPKDTDEKENHKTPEATASNSKPASSKTNRVLLIDDNTINQIVVESMLHDLKLDVDIRSNGIEAIKALKENVYSIVSMDCQMPEMDGYEATEKIREGIAGFNNTEIPIIAITANALDGDDEKCFRSGMNDYITKPVEEEKLKTIIQKWLA